MFLPRKDNRQTRARAGKGMGLAMVTVLVAGFTGLSGAASGSAAGLGPRSPGPAGPARLYAASAGAIRAEAAPKAPMDRRAAGDVTMPPRPALCSVGAIYGPDPIGAKDGGCLVDWYFGPTTPPGRVVRADGFLSLSAPSVIRLGVPFTLSVHAPYPACALAKEQPKTCVEQWDTDLRAVDSVASTQSDPAGVPLALKATSPSSDRSCGGGDIGIPGSVVGNRALTCQVEIVSLQPGFNPDGQWWALGGGVEDFSSMQGEIEAPVEIVGPGCAGALPTSSSDSQGARLTPAQQPAPRSPALSLFGAPASTCPLVVNVVPLEGSEQAFPLLSGLHYNPGSQEPSFFVPDQADPLPAMVGSRPVSGAPFEQKCGTGCANVFVYVREPGPEGQAVAGAKVTLQSYTVAPADATYPYPPVAGVPFVKPEGFDQFKGELCVVGGVNGVQEAGCGSSAQASTDSQGIAYFRYWAPGTVKDGTELLTATAVDKSPACDCRTGTAKANVHLSPNVVFDAYAPLTQQAVDYFSHWWELKMPFDDVSWATGIVTRALPELKWADELGKFATTQQKRDITAAYVLFSLFGLQPDGLLTLDYRDSLIGFGGGFLTSLESVMKDFGGTVHGRVELDRSHPTGVMQLVLTEQSYCGSHGSVFAAEGHPTLCERSPTSGYVLFSLGAAGDRSELALSDAFHEAPDTSVSYMPAVWMKAQPAKG